VLTQENLERLKSSKWVNWTIKCIIPAMLLFLLKWHWDLNDRIARIEENAKQDRAQWSAIKQVVDSDTEQEVRLRVAEKIQDWSIMVGILKNIATQTDIINSSKDLPDTQPTATPRLDVKEIFDKVKKERSKSPKKEVEQYIKQQMAK